MQNQMVILRSVLKVKFTKYCTCAAKNPGQPEQLSREWTGFFIILELEPYMLKAYLGKNEKSRLLVMCANPCGLGIWDFALLPQKSLDYYILFYMGV